MDKDLHVVTLRRLKSALSSFLSNVTSKFVQKTDISAIEFDSDSSYDLNLLNNLKSPYVYSNTNITITAATQTTITSKTLSAGTYLILSWVEGRQSGTGIMNNVLTCGTSHTTRTEENAGGGCTNFLLTTITSDTTLSFSAYLQTTTTCNAQMVVFQLV